jgi:acetyl-CoA carboxylase carboxyl transferase subunit alpha
VVDLINMLEHSVYSVITPEGCASILWRDAGRAEEAATAMKMTAVDLTALGLVDEVVKEPPGGAHSDHELTFKALDAVLARQLAELKQVSADALVEGRYAKFRCMGRLGREFVEAAS